MHRIVPLLWCSAILTGCGSEPGDRQAVALLVLVAIVLIITFVTKRGSQPLTDREVCYLLFGKC